MSAGRKSFVLFKTTTKKIPCCLGNTLLRLLHLKRDSVGYSTYMLRKSKKNRVGGWQFGANKSCPRSGALSKAFNFTARERAAAAKVAGPLDETGV